MVKSAVLVELNDCQGRLNNFLFVIHFLVSSLEMESCYRGYGPRMLVLSGYLYVYKNYSKFLSLNYSTSACYYQKNQTHYSHFLCFNYYSRFFNFIQQFQNSIHQLINYVSFISKLLVGFESYLDCSLVVALYQIRNSMMTDYKLFPSLWYFVFYSQPSSKANLLFFFLWFVYIRLQILSKEKMANLNERALQSFILESTYFLFFSYKFHFYYRSSIY